MTTLNQLELQNLRHLIGAHETVSNKLSDFSSQCTDKELSQILKCDTEDAKNAKNKLINFLR